MIAAAGRVSVMARARLLKPDFFEDERITALPFGARILYQALWCLADREGRLEDRPQRIAAFAFPPIGNETMQARARKEADAWLELLITSGMVQRYEAEGEHCLLIKRFPEHQKVHPNEPKSSLPQPLDTNGHQWLPIVTNVAGSGSGSGSRSRNKAEAEAKAETREDALRSLPAGFSYKTEPLEPDEPGFVGEYVRHYEKRHGKSPPGTHLGDARSLERDFGTAACVQAAADLDWDKPPAYLRPRMEDRRDKSNGANSGKPAAPTGTERVAARLRGLGQ